MLKELELPCVYCTEILAKIQQSPAVSIQARRPLCMLLYLMANVYRVQQRGIDRIAGQALIAQSLGSFASSTLCRLSGLCHTRAAGTSQDDQPMPGPAFDVNIVFVHLAQCYKSREDS